MALSDPYPMFEGRELMNNEGYLCYLNAISNGLLSLKSFRQLIQFMNPMMKNFFYHILIGEMKHLEALRIELHKFNPNFPRDIHSDACEALHQMIRLMDLDDLFKISLVETKRTQRCTVCAEQSIFSVDANYGNPNILMLQQSTENNVQEEVDNYIRNIKKEVSSNDVYCKKCQAFVTMTLSDSLKTNKILMIRICRFSDNFDKIDKEVNVNHILQVGTSKYKAKCFISHHGQSAEGGHYTTTILINNNLVFKYDDTIRSKKTTCSKDPYIIWYERIDFEEANIGKDESENPVEQNVELNKDERVNMEEKDDEDDVNPDDQIYDIEESNVREKNDESSNLLEMKADETGKVECKYCQNSYVNILIHLKKKTNCMENYVKNNEYDTLEKNYKKRKIQQEAYSKNHYERNKQKIKQNSKNHYERNKQKIKQNYQEKKQIIKTNEETKNASVNDHRNTGHESIKQQQKAYSKNHYEKNKQKIKQNYQEKKQIIETNKKTKNASVNDHGNTSHESKKQEQKAYSKNHYEKNKPKIQQNYQEKKQIIKNKYKLRRKRKYDSNEEKLSSDADSSKSPSKLLVTEKETFTCKICHKSHDNIEKLIKHINRSKCQYTNVKEFKKLQTQYLRINEVALISCLGCKKLFTINKIWDHITKKKKCNKEYIDRNEKKNLKKKINEQLKKTKRKTNAETNPKRKRITNPKTNERKRNYEIIKSGEETLERGAKNSKYDQSENILCKGCGKSFDDIKKMIDHLNLVKKKCRSNYNNVDLEDLKNKFLKLKRLELIKCLCCLKLFPITGILNHLTKSRKENCKEVYKIQNKLEPLLEKIQQRKKKMNLSHIKAFNQRQETGRDYVCTCCCTIRFRKSVQELTEELQQAFKDLNVYQYLSLDEKYQFDGKFWIHHNCLIILKKGKMPQICAKNGLGHCKIAQVFKDATRMEILAIKKTIPFTSIQQLPRSRMPYMKKSRIINVPISDNDVLKTVFSLPRVNDKLATVNLAFKTRQKERNYYKAPEVVRPNVINDMLKILQKEHKSYKDFPIELLSETSKYKFMTIPLVGEKEPDENTLTLTHVITNLLPTTLSFLKLRLGNINIPIDANSFIYALQDHIR